MADVIQYNYEIKRVDEAARCMEIVYTSFNRQTMHISARLPYEGEAVESVVRAYSPIAYWREQEAKVVIPQVGVKGVVDSTPQNLPVTIMSVLDFIGRFTAQEHLQITQASLSNAQLRIWYDKLIAAQYVDLADARIIEGMNAIVSAGLLTETRKTEILKVATATNTVSQPATITIDPIIL